MRIKSISYYLRPYRMLASRRTTINNAFAAAVAPFDKYDENRVATAMQALAMDPDAELRCAYCGALAETWDHVFATVKNSRFSGHGHRLGNLLPCCKSCNSQKGNKPWETHLSSLSMSEDEKAGRLAAINDYLSRYAVKEQRVENSADHERLDEIRRQILVLLEEGDDVAERIREANSKLSQDAC
jgi:hypothetical protein